MAYKLYFFSGSNRSSLWWHECRSKGHRLGLGWVHLALQLYVSFCPCIDL